MLQRCNTRITVACMNRFGQWLTKEREARSWSQPELARYLGVDKSMVLRWERGETLPHLPHFGKLTRLLCADANKVLRLVPKDDAAAA